MRRMFLIMIVLAFAMPAMAAVTISATDEGGGWVRIDYSTDANVSAFALEVSFINGATIEDVCGYHEGESITGSKGYGIFLDKVNGIKISGGGEVLDAGTPIAHNDSSDDANGTGLGTDKVILELGALYGEGNQPALSGTLCKVKYDLLYYWFETPPTTTMTIVANATRGNVVLENATAATLAGMPVTLASLGNTGLATCITQNHLTPDYSPTGLNMGGGPAYKDYNDWVAVGQPGCWCIANDPNANPRQCWGDADEFAEGRKKYWAAVQDLTVLLDAWQKPYTHATDPCVMGMTTSVGSAPAIVVPWICADFDHFGEGRKKYRVAVWDLNILLANWQIVDTRTVPPLGLPDPNCP